MSMRTLLNVTKNLCLEAVLEHLFSYMSGLLTLARRRRIPTVSVCGVGHAFFIALGPY